MTHRWIALGFLLALVASNAAGDACPHVGFVMKQSLPMATGRSIGSLQTIDFDRDGHLDLVGSMFVNGYGYLHSWRGVGDGTFFDPVLLGEVNVADLQVIDVNHDGYDDLVGANVDHAIWVRLGNGSGFDAAITTHVDYFVSKIQAGDFHEGNSDIDLVASSFQDGVIAVYRGNGDGTFTEVRRINAGANKSIEDHAAADFDNDGRIDIAVASRGSTQLEIYFRNADGTFAAPVLIDTGYWAFALATADFNEDGLVDLASVNDDENTIDIFRNLGGRAFSRQTLNGRFPGFAYSSSLVGIRLADVNADSHVDILASSVNGGWVATLLGDGAGAFSSATFFQDQRGGGFSAVTGNFDADADLEIVVGTYDALVIGDSSCAPEMHVYPVAPLITFGQVAKLRAVISGITPNMPARGTVTFREGSTVLGTIGVDDQGVAALDAAGLSVGDHTIVAEFSGNPVIPAVLSQSVVQKVTAGHTSIALTIATSTHGEPFNASIVMTSQHGYVIAEPYVELYTLIVDGIAERQLRMTGQLIQLTLNAGPHTLAADFRGDRFEPPSTSPTYLFTTAKHSVALAKSGDTNVRQGTAHTVQISVTAPTSPSPTGTVALFRGATQVGSGALANGVATITATLPRGTYQYTATYTGDANYLTGSTSFTLTVMTNSTVAIDARTAGSTISIPALVPQGTTATTMYRRIHGTLPWSAVPSWSTGSSFDTGPFTNGVVYDYRLDATVSNQLQQSNIDTAVVYTDPTLDAGVATIKLAHFTELRDAINALRAAASLPPFAFDGTFGAGAVIRESHLSAMRTAVSEARAALGMAPLVFTDGSPSGAIVKRAHIMELRDAAD